MSDQATCGLIDVGTTRLYHEVCGRGPAVLFVTGGTGDAGEWADIAPRLADEFTVVTYDRRGFSRSPRPDGWTQTSMAEQAGDAAGLLRALGLAPAVVVGHSSGGSIACRLVIDHPEVVRHAVIYEPPLFAGVPGGEEVVASLQALHEGEPRRGMERFMRRNAGDETVDLFAAVDPTGFERVLDNGAVLFDIELPALTSFVPDREGMRASGVPLTVVAGEQDTWMAASSRWLSEATGADLIAMPGGHVGFVVHPKEFAELVCRIARQAHRPAGRVDAQAVEVLRQRLRGPLLTPGDSGFGDATLLWNGLISKTPALAVQPTGTADVVAAVDFARDHGLALSARGGGHNVGGTAVADGGLTIDMSHLRGVVVDPVARTATVQPGCLLGDVDRETQLHGLATPLGFVSEVGVAGLTLGGGLGYLTRRFGWTVDNLLEVEIVTADGQVRRASRDEHADLFWAIRGAGANLGVVTSFTFRLHPVGPTVYGGLIAWPLGRAGEILKAYRAMTAEAPRELAVWMVFVQAPAAPFVPQDWQGERVCAMAVCYSGDLGAVDEVIAPIRALGDPVIDLLQEQPYTQVQSYLDAATPKGHHYYWKTEYLAELSDGFLSTLRDLAAECPIPEAELGLLHLGGALEEHDEDDGAVGNRDARYVFGVIGSWAPDEPGAQGFPGWVRDAWQRVRPFSTGRTYINFQTADEGDDRIRATYGANFDRLVQVKTTYDPSNLFRSNRNIPPRAK